MWDFPSGEETRKKDFEWSERRPERWLVPLNELADHTRAEWHMYTWMHINEREGIKSITSSPQSSPCFVCVFFFYIFSHTNTHTDAHFNADAQRWDKQTSLCGSLECLCVNGRIVRTGLPPLPHLFMQSNLAPPACITVEECHITELTFGLLPCQVTPKK